MAENFSPRLVTGLLFYSLVCSTTPSCRPDSKLESKSEYVYVNLHERKFVVPCPVPDEYRGSRVCWVEDSGYHGTPTDCSGLRTTQTTGVMQEKDTSSRGGMLLKFFNITMASHNTSYYCLVESVPENYVIKHIRIFVRSTMTDPEVLPLTIMPGGYQRTYTRADANNYVFSTNATRLVQIKCGISLNTLEPYTLQWVRIAAGNTTSIVLPRLRHDLNDVPVYRSFTDEPLTWLRSNEKWLNLYITIQSLRKMSQQYECYVLSCSFYRKERVLVTKVQVKL